MKVMILCAAVLLCATIESARGQSATRPTPATSSPGSTPSAAGAAGAARQEVERAAPSTGTSAASDKIRESAHEDRANGADESELHAVVLEQRAVIKKLQAENRKRAKQLRDAKAKAASIQHEIQLAASRGSPECPSVQAAVSDLIDLL